MANMNIDRISRSGNPAAEGAGSAALDPALRTRIATAIEGLIALLDHAEPQNEDTAIFEGHSAYQPFTLADSNYVGAGSLDPDTESDTADDEDDDPGEEHDPGEDEDSDDDRDSDNAVDMVIHDGYLTVDDGELEDDRNNDYEDEQAGFTNPGHGIELTPTSSLIRQDLPAPEEGSIPVIDGKIENGKLVFDHPIEGRMVAHRLIRGGRPTADQGRLR